MALSPSGKLLATGSASGQIELREAYAGQLVVRFFAHDEQLVSALKFTSDGTQLVSSGYDGSVQWRDFVENEVWGTKAEGSRVWDLDVSPDGPLYAFSSPFADVQVWQVHGEEPLKRIPLTSFSVGVPVAFSPNGKKLATMTAQPGPFEHDQLSDELLPTYNSSELLIYDLEKNEPHRTRDIGLGWLSCCTYSDDGAYLAGGIQDGVVNEVIVWSVDSGAEIARFTGHRRAVRDIAFSTDNRILISASDDSTLLIWDLGKRLSPER